MHILHRIYCISPNPEKVINVQILYKHAAHGSLPVSKAFNIVPVCLGLISAIPSLFWVNTELIILNANIGGFFAEIKARVSNYIHSLTWDVINQTWLSSAVVWPIAKLEHGWVIIFHRFERIWLFIHALNSKQVKVFSVGKWGPTWSYI